MCTNILTALRLAGFTCFARAVFVSRTCSQSLSTGTSKLTSPEYRALSEFTFDAA